MEFQTSPKLLYTLTFSNILLKVIFPKVCPPGTQNQMPILLIINELAFISFKNSRIFPVIVFG